MCSLYKFLTISLVGLDGPTNDHFILLKRNDIAVLSVILNLLNEMTRATGLFLRHSPRTTERKERTTPKPVEKFAKTYLPTNSRHISMYF